MIRRSLGLYIAGAVIGVLSLFLVTTMSLSLSGAINLFKTTYNITFKNYDDTVLSIEKVDKGEEAVYTGEFPERPATDDFYYVFIGWDRSLTNVQSSFITYAQYSKITNKGEGTGTQTGTNDDGGSQGQTQDNGGTSHTGPGEDTVGGGGDGDGVGGASGGSGGGGGDMDNLEGYDNLQIKTAYNGDVYLRSYSYGCEYDPEANEWTAPLEMFELTEGLTNPLFYTASRAANVDGLTSRTIALHYSAKDLPVPVPQYPFKFISTKEMSYKNDRYVPFTMEFEQEYVFAPFLYTAEREALLRTAPVNQAMVAEELRYQSYVNDNYLFFDYDHYYQINNLRDINNFSSMSSSQIIEATIDVVKGLGKVNYDFIHEDPNTDLHDPIANLFVDEIARPETYANVATFLLRSSGLPARTVKGYIKNTHGAEEFVDVLPTDTYYWSEVYVYGVGWMLIDPIPDVYTSEGSPEQKDGHMEGEIEAETMPLENEDEVYDVLTVNTTVGGLYHLRERSYVDYNDGTWGYNDVNTFTSATINPLYYTSDKMQSAGISSSGVTIDYLVPFDYYPSPQYEAVYNMRFKNDNSAMVEPTNNRYATSSYFEASHKTIIDDLSSVARSNVNEIEVNDYHDFVYNNYLSVPSELVDGLNLFILNNELDSSDPYVVDKVTTILRDSGEYVYDDPVSSTEDPVIHFLNTSKVGKCSLFASASTLLYRQLGIPARYVTGYVADTRDNNPVTLNTLDHHAWCEVYDDNVGWIIADNTTGLDLEYSEDWSQEHKEDSEESPTIPFSEAIKLYFSFDGQVATYSGSPITINESAVHTINLDGLKANHQVVGFSFKKQYVNVGSYSVEIQPIVIDTVSGHNVSALYLAIVDGTLTINHRNIVITSGSANKTYDGTPLTCSTITSANIASGHKLTAKTLGTITEVGSCMNTIDPSSIVITDANGQDVSKNYKISYEYGVLTVNE